MTFDKNTLALVGAVSAIPVLVCGVTIIFSKKRQKNFEKHIENKLGVLDKIADAVVEKNMPIEVPKDILDSAIERRINTVADAMVHEACDEASSEVSHDIKARVSREVNAAYNDIKGSVTEEVAKKVGNIDIYEIKKTVITDAKAEVRKRFSKELDDILADAKRQVNTAIDKFDDEAIQALDKAEADLSDKTGSLIDKYTSNLDNAARVYDSLNRKLRKNI